MYRKLPFPDWTLFAGNDQGDPQIDVSYEKSHEYQVVRIYGMTGLEASPSGVIQYACNRLSIELTIPVLGASSRRFRTQDIPYTISLMLDALLNLPALLGCLILMITFVVVGQAIRVASQKILFQDKQEALQDATRTVFLAVNLILGLFLSLSLNSVVDELRQIQDDVQREAVAISDVYNGLGIFDTASAGEIQLLLIEYTKALIVEDWPSLAKDRLADRPEVLLRKIWSTFPVLNTGSNKESFYFTRIGEDLDSLSNYRLARLHHALGHPPFFLLIVVFGMVVVTVCLGLYRASRALIFLVSLYLSFVGLVVYLILALSDPFGGVMSVAPTSLEYVLEEMLVLDTLSNR